MNLIKKIILYIFEIYKRLSKVEKEREKLSVLRSYANLCMCLLERRKRSLIIVHFKKHVIKHEKKNTKQISSSD